ncbi:ABC transporter permease subunit [Paenibacillus alginolyticus]|uniref:ABC transporter permease subunit n=1 Tax=Paenibacillus alginolyticus TaxID=59839 RepID=UPI0003FDE675|nr:ABC transporter permease subunit [Paenibacillus alginolyticus]MCY9666487.1 ABC transporter permease subunit [Paenibacillus alginolyticus]
MSVSPTTVKTAIEVRRPARHQTNWTYLLAWTGLIVLLLTAIFGSVLKPYEIDNKYGHMETGKLMQDAAGKSKFPPLEPDSKHWLGTDHRGVDLFSLILNGMKFTIFVALSIVIMRFIIAVSLGLYVGINQRGSGFLSIMNKLTSSVPALIMIYPLLTSVYVGLRLNMPMPVDHPNQKIFTAIYMACIIFTGIFPLAEHTYRRAQHVNEKLFVYTSKTMGASKFRIAFRHILPNIKEELVFAFLSEFVQVMFIIGQLAVLGLFIGSGQTLFSDLGAKGVQYTNTGEWCALIAYGIQHIRTFPWIMGGIITFYILTLLIIQFFLTQLKKKQSRSM